MSSERSIDDDGDDDEDDDDDDGPQSAVFARDAREAILFLLFSMVFPSLEDPVVLSCGASSVRIRLTWEDELSASVGRGLI